MKNRYYLAPGVKVRDEDFGLLFYLCQSTDLVFINSGRFLEAAALKEGGSLGDILGDESSAKRLEQGRGLFNKLVGKGLLTVASAVV